jgi:putative transposase
MNRSTSSTQSLPRENAQTVHSSQPSHRDSLHQGLCLGVCAATTEPAISFITTSCYQRRPLLSNPRDRDLFLRVLEQVRRRYQFVLVGYVVMPEHVHLLVSEPERANPSVVMQALKQGFARRLFRRWRARQNDRQACLWDAALSAGHIWQRRFYDFVVSTERKRVERLRYMHRNPVKRGLVLEPDQWRWGSYRHYACGEAGPVFVNEQKKAELKVRVPR